MDEPILDPVHPETEATESPEDHASEPKIMDLWQQRAMMMEARLKPLEEQATAEKDKALRALAELENFKRRKEQEVDQFKKYAQERFVLELLPVLDSFDRACEHSGSADSGAQDQVNGFLLIQKQFHQALEKWGVVAVDALGQPFDPNLHQAVMEEEVTDTATGTVTKEMQKGYKLHDRVIRPAMVAVAK